MNSEFGQDRRIYARLRYPKSERPSIDILGQTFQVCEISELGMRLLFRSSERVSLGVKVTGTVHFYDNEDVEVEGIPLRQHASEVALKLSKGLPPEKISEERDKLMKKYPDSVSVQGAAPQNIRHH